MSTSVNVPPPEDTQLDCESSNSILHIGGTGSFLTNTKNLLGVERKCVWFTFGRSNLAVDVWNAGFQTPSFTVNAYLSHRRKLILSVGCKDLTRAQAFRDKANALVLLDNNPATLNFAKNINCPDFSGPDALYWAFREVLLC